MDDSEFHDLVAGSDAVDEPAPIVEATLATLGEALSGDEREETAKWLPRRYAETLTDADDEAAASFSAETFLERVRDREAERRSGSAETATDSTLRARIGAVADAIAVTVPHDELLTVRSQLPDEIGSLFTENEGGR